MKLSEAVAAGTYSTNMFGRCGILFRDPRFLIYLQHHDGTRGEEFGDDSVDDPQVYIEWLAMNQLGVTLGKMRSYCEEHDPRMVVVARKPASVVVPQDDGGFERINLDPGAEVLFSWKGGVEKVLRPDSEILYERKHDGIRREPPTTS